MPLFSVFFGAVMGQLASFLAQFMTRKVAVVTAALTALGTVSAALLAAFNGFVTPLMAHMFNTQYGQFLGLAFPPIAGTCMATMGACWAACVLYRWQIQALNVSVQA